MTIQQGETTSFRKEKLLGIHDFANDTFKMALYTNLADLGPDTTVYTTSEEVEGTGYTAGGQEVFMEEPATEFELTGEGDNRTMILDFEDVVWEGSTLTARCCLIYNASKGNKAVWVYDWLSDRSSDGGPFRVRPPEPTAVSAAYRIVDPA